jgi:hypothetical protein
MWFSRWASARRGSGRCPRPPHPPVCAPAAPAVSPVELSQKPSDLGPQHHTHARGVPGSNSNSNAPAPCWRWRLVPPPGRRWAGGRSQGPGSGALDLRVGALYLAPPRAGEPNEKSSLLFRISKAVFAYGQRGISPLSAYLWPMGCD